MTAARVAASLLALLAVALGYGVLVPLAPELASRALTESAEGRTAFHTGAMSFVYLGSLAVFAPAWGHVAPAMHVGTKAVAGLAAFGIAFGLLSSVQAVGMIYALLTVAGAAAAAVVPALQGQLGRVASEISRGRLVALFGAASFAGWFTGPVLASWGRSLFGPGVTTWSFGLVGALGLLASVAVAIATAPASESLERPCHAPSRVVPSLGTGRVALAAMAATFGIGSLEVSLVLWGTQVLRLEPPILARMLLECTVVMMAVQSVFFLMPAILPRWRPASVAPSFAMMGVALALVPLRPAAWVAFAAVALIAVSATLLQAMLAVHLVASDDGSGKLLGLQLGFANGGQAIGSLAAGSLFDATGASFYAAAAVVGAAALWSLRAR